MKKIVFLLAFVLVTFINTQAQTVGVVDTKQILQEIPEYNNAQKQLDQIVDGWRKEIEQKHKKVDEMYRAYQAEQVLLTENERSRREQAIVDKEKEMREFQKTKFGPEGELFQKRQELVQPIQDDVYEAIEKAAKKKKIDIVFDKSEGASILFFTKDYDMTSSVLRELGISTN
ncbi:MAG: OmpH family outer membrane protein [Chitinophagales bacterium]